MDYLETGESGLVVPAELPGPLDGAIRTLLNDADQRLALGQNARRRLAESFTVDRMIANTEAVYRTVDASGPQHG